MSCLFEIHASETELRIDTTEELAAHHGMITLFRPFDPEKLPTEKLGDTGLALVSALNLPGVKGIHLDSYYLRVEVARLFDIGTIHRALEVFILEHWTDAVIRGDRPAEIEEYINFVITSGPDRDTILRVLDHGPANPEQLLFRGHLPGSNVEETLAVRLGKLVAQRDFGHSLGDRFFRFGPTDDGRLVWDMMDCKISVGPEPTLEQLSKSLKHPDARWLTHVIVRFDDATGEGLVLDDSIVEET